MLVREQLVELGPIAKREPNLHIEGAFDAASPSEVKASACDGMVSGSGGRHRSHTRDEVIGDDREAERAKPDGESDNPAISKRTAGRCRPPMTPRIRRFSSNKGTIEKVSDLLEEIRALIQSIVTSMLRRGRSVATNGLKMVRLSPRYRVLVTTSPSPTRLSMRCR